MCINIIVILKSSGIKGEGGKIIVLQHCPPSYEPHELPLGSRLRPSRHVTKRYLGTYLQTTVLSTFIELHKRLLLNFYFLHLSVLYYILCIYHNREYHGKSDNSGFKILKFLVINKR